jgi:hypothetical protein
VQKRFENPEASVVFERIGSAPLTLSFSRKQTQLESKHVEALDLIGQHLQKFSTLQAEIDAGSDSSEREDAAERREQAITAYLFERWKIGPERLELTPGALTSREAIVRLIHAPPKREP